jgi:hypothetical protein
MFGTKINEFDNSDGTLDSFNKIFPKTTIGESCGKYVEIGDIVERKNMFAASPFVRYLDFYDGDFNKINRVIHDFGENNFINNEDYDIDGSIRFKYIARGLDGTVLAKAYNFEELAQKLQCSVNSVKRRIKKPIDENTNTDLKFNITRIEL